MTNLQINYLMILIYGLMTKNDLCLLADVCFWLNCYVLLQRLLTIKNIEIQFFFLVFIYLKSTKINFFQCGSCLGLAFRLPRMDSQPIMASVVDCFFRDVIGPQLCFHLTHSCIRLSIEKQLINGTLSELENVQATSGIYVTEKNFIDVQTALLILPFRVVLMLYLKVSGLL